VAEPILHLQLCVVAVVMGLFSMFINLAGGSMSLYIATALLSCVTAGVAGYAAFVDAETRKAGSPGGLWGTGGDPVPGDPSERSLWTVTLVKAEIVEGDTRVGKPPSTLPDPSGGGLVVTHRV
jgi:hypothetical protein